MSNQIRKKTVLFDKIFGEIAFFILVPILSLRKKTTEVPASFKKILLIKTGGIGDYLLSIPAFKKLRSAYPDAEITIFMFNRNKNCLEFYNDFNKVVVIDDPKNLLEFIFKGERYDLCIDFDQHRKIPSVLSIFSLAPLRIGFDRMGKGKAYTHKVAYPLGEYVVQSFMNLLSPLGLSKRIERQDYMLRNCKEEDRLPLSVAIYACAMKEDNRLSLDDWETIIRKKGNDFIYYFIGGREDKDRYNAIQGRLSEFRINRADGTTSLIGSLDLLSKCKEMYAEDGGTYHMGVVAGIPSITGYWMHGIDDMKRWGAPEANNIVVAHNLRGKNDECPL